MDETDAKRRVSSISGSSGSLSAPDLPPADSQSGASKAMCLVGIGIGVFGVLFGITGIVMANGASTELAALQQKVDKMQDPLMLLKPTLDDYDSRIGTVAADVLRANNGVHDLTTKMQQVGKALSEDREQINRNTAALGRRGLPAAKPATAEKSEAAGAPASATTTNAAGQKVHAIQKNDTFTTLSKEYGVSVKAIQEANPNADSSHLNIGQQIVIPAEK